MSIRKKLHKKILNFLATFNVNRLALTRLTTYHFDRQALIY